MTTRYRMNRLPGSTTSARQKQPPDHPRDRDHLLQLSLPEHLPAFSQWTPCRPTLDAVLRLSVAFILASAAAIASQASKLSENPLQIIAAGVQRSEDAPFIPSDFRFLSGDYVYCQFQITGYTVKTFEDSDVRKISLTYEISPQDAKGVSLTPSATGVIKEDLGPEDKNWTPKRRSSFLLPSFIAAGEFHLHLAVKDLIGNTSTELDLPFHTGGVVVVPSATLAVQDFQFLRNEDDAEPLDVPAFRPGDTVYARFNMTGFRLNDGNEYHLSYGLIVNRPDGKPYLDAQSAAELSSHSFYPVPYVPGNISITTTRATSRGEYVVLLTVRDLAGSQTYQLKRAFTIE